MLPLIFQCGFLFINRVKIKKWLYGCMAARFFPILLIKLKVFILSDCSILWRKTDHKQWQQSLFITIVTNLLAFNCLFVFIYIEFSRLHVLIILEDILFHEFISLYYLCSQSIGTAPRRKKCKQSLTGEATKFSLPID
mgnify:CR=1 FL=1